MDKNCEVDRSKETKKCLELIYVEKEKENLRFRLLCKSIMYNLHVCKHVADSACVNARGTMHIMRVHVGLLCMHVSKSMQYVNKHYFV